MSTPNDTFTLSEAEAVKDLSAAYKTLTEQIGKVIVGQQRSIEQLLMALFSRGHCLLVGVPGLAKTLLVSTVSQILHLSFKRIQFTPDLMPADITGTDILQDDPDTGRRKFVFLQGPDLRQHGPGRRDQPHAAQDAGRPARSHAGAPRHRRRRRPITLPRAVLRAGDAEPDRAGRHLSAARGPARPLHVQHRRRLPQPGRRAADHEGDDRHEEGGAASQC